MKKCSNAPLANSLRTFLGSGEAETIALALELKEAEFVILDDLKARRLFKRLGIDKKLMGTIGILKAMIARGIVEETGSEVAAKLEYAGFHFSRDLLRDC